MIRLTTLCAAALVLSSAAGIAQDTKRAGDAASFIEKRNDANEQGLESITDEVSDVGVNGSEEDGMSKAVAETEGAENDDTCIRADGEVGCDLD